MDPIEVLDAFAAGVADAVVEAIRLTALAGLAAGLIAGIAVYALLRKRRG